MSNAEGKKRLAAAMDEARRIEKEIFEADQQKANRQSERLVAAVTHSRNGGSAT